MTTLGRIVAIGVLAVVALGLLGCGDAASATPTATGTVTLTLTAGPVCPVERIPPDPACAPRPVPGAVVAILDGDREVVRGTSNADGRIDFSLPFGRYTVRPLAPASGFPAPPGDQLIDLGPEPIELALDYDTGIR